jgi:hypothetical protein
LQAFVSEHVTLLRPSTSRDSQDAPEHVISLSGPRNFVSLHSPVVAQVPGVDSPGLPVPEKIAPAQARLAHEVSVGPLAVAPLQALPAVLHVNFPLRTSTPSQPLAIVHSTWAFEKLAPLQEFDCVHVTLPVVSINAPLHESAVKQSTAVEPVIIAPLQEFLRLHVTFLKVLKVRPSQAPSTEHVASVCEVEPEKVIFLQASFFTHLTSFGLFALKPLQALGSAQVTIVVATAVLVKSTFMQAFAT